jgi:hypothetical protein
MMHQFILFTKFRYSLNNNCKKLNMSNSNIINNLYNFQIYNKTNFF